VTDPRLIPLAIGDLSALRALAAQNGNLDAWCDVTLQWAGKAADEIARLRAENAALRASLGEPTGAEPIGCPCPGACSATALQARLAERDRQLAEAREARDALAESLAAQYPALRLYWEQIFDRLDRALAEPDAEENGDG